MFRLRFLLAVLALCFWPPAFAIAQEEVGAESSMEEADATLVPTPPGGLKEAEFLAKEGGIPLSTTLTDVATKTGAEIQSGLSQPPDTRVIETQEPAADFTISEPPGGTFVTRFGPVSSDSRSAYLNLNDLGGFGGAEVAKYAVDKGYTPRTIEFDSRFQTNVARLQSYAEPRSTGTAGNKRIWNGLAVSPKNDAFADTVAILGNGGICTGTLVSPRLVLTAGHCFCGGVKNEVLIGNDILSPLHRIPVVDGESETFRQCDALDANIKAGDVALLKLERDAPIPPRPLADISFIRDAASVRAVGFGRTETGRVGFKYQVNIVIASFQCDGTALAGVPDHQVYQCQPTYELVAAGLNRDACNGDSGGPIYVVGPDARVYLAGVTSRAVDPNGGCGPGGIYVLPAASPIREWLVSKGVDFHSE